MIIILNTCKAKISTTLKIYSPAVETSRTVWSDTYHYAYEFLNTYFSRLVSMFIVYHWKSISLASLWWWVVRCDQCICFSVSSYNNQWYLLDAIIAGDEDIEHSVLDHIEVVPVVALPDYVLPGLRTLLEHGVQHLTRKWYWILKMNCF